MKEGFDGCEDDVVSIVKAAANKLTNAGAVVEDMSIPLHSDGNQTNKIDLVVLGRRSGLSWFNWWVSFAPEFQCCYFCESSCLFYLSFNSDLFVSKITHL